MFKTKSFDLKNDEAGKKREHLYQPRKAQWLKYIMQPATIAFVIILIVCNIDFSDEPDEESPSMNKTDCREHLSLLFENYHFPNGAIQRNIFYGEYTLQSLVLSNCQLKHIADGTFDQKSLRNIQNLELINTKLRKLTNETFRGLNKLSNFTLINRRRSLSCKGFLLPVAHSLRAAKISLQYTNYKVYKPAYFFGQAVYKQLKVLDLSGNNIGETVEINSFGNMPALESLNLANYDSEAIDATTTTTTIANTTRATSNRDNQAPAKTTKAPSTTTTTTPISTVWTRPIPTDWTTTIPTTWTTDDTPSDLTTAWDIPTTTDLANDDSLLYDDIICVNAERETLSTTSIAYNAQITIVEDSQGKSCLRELLWFEAHSVPIITSAIVGMLLCVTLGLFAIYGILWLRPTWLWGSKRLLRPTSQSNTMLLLPRDYEKEAYDTIRYPDSKGNINEYASYYRHLEAQLYRGESNKYNVPPIERAPSIPPSLSKSTISTNPNTYTYECFELYEELY
ncbi:uncharacterized protein LOC111600137 [Drosophila hydei]|uniref:Uncharacterized protein LOC111600137 n=1 Tax=Drosophila hydei TaxID=7224 RepID=A0A6J2SZD0_DROHY|nr:uncharacterized protein LOC111600137 [Drosophila hydei]